MKNILCILFSIFSLGLFSQTTALSFSTISNDYLRPGAGANNWNDGYVVPIPPGGSTGVSAGIDRYMRLAWSQIENDDSSFNWTQFDVRAQIAINAGQKFSIAWMPYGEGVFSNSSPGGVPVTYPATLHTQMQAETNKDWNGGDTWVPNMNSPSYLRRYKRLMLAIANHIATTTYNGVPYSKIIYMVDVRVFGNFGECHNYPYTNSDGKAPNGQAMPSYLNPGQAVCDTIVSWYCQIFPNNPLTILHLFYNNGGDSQVPLESIYNVFTTHNNWGPIGWRRDSWGDATNYLYILENNPYSYNPGSGNYLFKTAIMSRYQTAPVNGEPLNGLASYSDLDVEVKRYGVSSFGNGNIANPTTPSVVTAIQQASFDAGARFQLNPTGSTISSAIHPTANFQITLSWANIGASPCYEKWNATYILKSAGTVVQTWISKFQPKFFQPGTQNIVDNLSVGSIGLGNYSLFIKIIDSAGYRKPMMISNTGMQSDTSYLITNITVTSGTANPPPTVSANVDQTITAPANTATLAGTVSPNSPAVSANGTWTEVSGPTTVTFSPNANTLNPTVGNLSPGTYLLQLLGTDNNGLTATDQMQIIVNPALVSPTVTGASNYTLTLPSNTLAVTRTITLHGASTYTAAWTNVSGPTTATFSPSNSNSTTIGNLITAGTYITQLVITDNNSQSTMVKDTVVVNAAPTGCALCIVSSGLDKVYQVSPYAVKCWGARNLVYDTTYYPFDATDIPPGSYLRGDRVWVNFDSLPKCKPPTVTVPNYTVTLPTNSVKISIQAKGNNKNAAGIASGIKSYNTIQKSGITITVQNGMTSTPTISNLVAGTVILTITVKDSCGALTNYVDTIVVKPAPVPVAKILKKSVYVPAEKQFNLTYSDGSVVYVNLLAGKTLMWWENDYNPNKLVVWYTDNTTQSYQ